MQKAGPLLTLPLDYLKSKCRLVFLELPAESNQAGKARAQQEEGGRRGHRCRRRSEWQNARQVGVADVERAINQLVSNYRLLLR